MIQNTWQSEATEALINDIVDTFEEDSCPGIRSDILSFLNSVSIKHLKFRTKGNIVVPHFNIYADGRLISDDDAWSYLRDSLAMLSYTSPMQGKGYSDISPFNCGICHRVDHPTGMCEFPQKEAWHSPTCDSVTKSLPFIEGRYNRGPRNNRQSRF